MLSRLKRGKMLLARGDFSLPSSTYIEMKVKERKCSHSGIYLLFLFELTTFSLVGIWGQFAASLASGISFFSIYFHWINLFRLQKKSSLDLRTAKQSAYLKIAAFAFFASPICLLASSIRLELLWHFWNWSQQDWKSKRAIDLMEWKTIVEKFRFVSELDRKFIWFIIQLFFWLFFWRNQQREEGG